MSEAEVLKKRVEELELKLVALGNLAVADWDDKTVGEVDRVVDPYKTTYNDHLRTLFTKNPERIKELELENFELKKELEHLKNKQNDLQRSN